MEHILEILLVHIDQHAVFHQLMNTACALAHNVYWCTIDGTHNRHTINQLIEHCMLAGQFEMQIYIIYSVRLSVHEDVTPQGVIPPLQLLLPLNLTLFVIVATVVVVCPAAAAVLIYRDGIRLPGRGPQIRVFSQHSGPGRPNRGRRLI
jgi:hypothetical protein